LTALGWRSVAGFNRAGRSVVVALALTVTLALAWPQFAMLNQYHRARAIPDFAAIGRQAWPPDSIARSNYLLLADAVRRSMPGPSGTLSSSASMLALFPLSGFLPPAYGMEDLSNVAVGRGRWMPGHCEPRSALVPGRDHAFDTHRDSGTQASSRRP
jgi:hypothetical protein